MPRDWNVEEEQFLRTCGLPDLLATPALNARFGTHRSYGSVRSKRRALGLVSTKSSAGQSVEREESKGTVTLSASGPDIRTVDQLLARSQIDLTKYEVTNQRVRSWDAQTPDGPTQMYSLSVSVTLKDGPSPEDAVKALVAGAMADRKPMVRPAHRSAPSDLLQGLVIADPHIAKLAWGEGTGGPDYDTGIAVKTLRDGATALLAAGRDRKVGKRGIWLLGDFYHHDGQGTTTQGTVLDYDSRVQKMMRAGAELLFDLIAASADEVPTEVVLVPGNHDRTSTTALQLILESEFRKDKRVSINRQPRTTKYLQHGKVLIGLDHGDKGKKRLAEIMPHDCAVEWGQTTYREFHTGHLHSKAAIETHGGITVRTHGSIAPADQWHVDEKFSTSPRLMEAFVYHSGGALVGSDAWSPDLHAQPKRGTR